MRHILGNLHGFHPGISFKDLTVVDKLMVHSLHKFLQQQQQLMDTSLDIKAYVENQKEFMTSQIINFYMEFSKNRLLTQKGTDDFLSC